MHDGCVIRCAPRFEEQPNETDQVSDISNLNSVTFDAQHLHLGQLKHLQRTIPGMHAKKLLAGRRIAEQLEGFIGCSLELRFTAALKIGWDCADTIDAACEVLTVLDSHPTN
jgi:hypothetical protein